MAAIQNGLVPSVRTQRRALFGQNSLDIQGKSTVSLLIDEVGKPSIVFFGPLKGCVASGHPPVLHIPNREHSSMVPG